MSHTWFLYLPVIVCIHWSLTFSKFNFSIFIENTISSSTNFKIIFSQRTDKLFIILLVNVEEYEDEGIISSDAYFLN